MQANLIQIKILLHMNLFLIFFFIHWYWLKNKCRPFLCVTHVYFAAASARMPQTGRTILKIMVNGTNNNLLLGH